MKRIVFTMIAVAMCLNISYAQEETAVSSIEHWFDHDNERKEVSASPEFSLDCSELSPGLHTLHFRAADSRGKYSSLQAHTFYKTTYKPTATSISSIQYWIDDQQDSAKISNSNIFEIDCKRLTTGIHTLHCRAIDNTGHFSTQKSHSFLKVNHDTITRKMSLIQYWWDDMSANAVEAPCNDSIELVLSTDALPYGLHSLRYRVKDNADRWSESRLHYFYKGEVTDSARIVSYEYWWNNLTNSAITKEIEEPTANFSLDEDFTVPDEARTNYAGHYTATLNIAITDNRGRRILHCADVEYPDNDAPTTDIDADKYVASSSVTINWIELSNDKMGDYNVYVSKDGGPFLLWLPDTTNTSATFKGERGSNYVFTVTGRDASGNREKYDESKCVSVIFE